MTPATTFSVASTGSIAAIRGGITVSASKTFAEGFLYGVQGKATLAGLIAEGAAARITGVLGQTDLSTGTVTLGQVSALWADLQGNPTLTVNDEVYALRVTNSMSSLKKAEAMAFFYGAADFCFEFGDPSSTWIATPTGATASGTLRTLLVNVGGQTLKILAAGTYSS